MKNKTIGVNSTPKPQAWVAVSNSRKKIYGKNEDVVYLDKEQEFQIELYNPTSISYLAKIYLNSKLISSSGLVIRPGQRYFLDRYIDDKNKFLFSTYEVENSAEVKNAIKNNGNVKVEFYPEFNPAYSYGVTTLTNPFAYEGGGVCYTSTSNIGTIKTNSLSSVTLTNSGCYFNNSSMVNELNTIETGRIEKGKDSDQHFSLADGNYMSIWTYCSEYRILPRSTKPVEIDEIRDYCVGCGTRIKKKTWKFCPSCGCDLG